MTREEANMLIAAIEAQVVEETPAKPKLKLKPGDLIEVWGHGADYVCVERYLSELSDGRVMVQSVSLDGEVSDGNFWEQYRKLETSATRREWAGGECPVSKDTIVTVQTRYGIYRTAVAKCFRWAHHREDNDLHDGGDIVAYWVLESE